MLKRGKKPSREADKVAELFQAYKDKGEDGVGPEGTERLCRDLGLDPADRKVLLLAWKMSAQRMGYFSRQEWNQGFQRLRVNSLAGVKQALLSVEEEVKDPDAFLDFFEFAFKFCLTEARQKIIDLETAIQMLSITLVGNPHLEPFITFLGKQTEYKTMTLDQWQGLGRFTQEVNASCSNYDDSLAWPLLLDMYVEWRDEQKW